LVSLGDDDMVYEGGGLVSVMEGWVRRKEYASSKFVGE
jgi:hypothetical protein